MNNISYEDAVQMVKSSNALFVDVRENDEWQDGHIDGAKHASISNFPQSFEALQINEDRPLIVYCAKGGRSARAIEFLEQSGLHQGPLYNLENGYSG